MSKVLTLPNLITCVRIAGAITLVWIRPFSVAFYALYLLSGASDGLDGLVARMTGQVSDFGRLLDSIADLLLYSIVFVKILPALLTVLSGWVWAWLAAAVLLRLLVYGLIAVKFHRFAATHTWMDKVSSILVFLVPFTIMSGFGEWGCSLALLAATVASLEELLMFGASSRYDPSRRSLFEGRSDTPDHETHED